MSSDVVLINGHVMTVDPINPAASAVAIRAGRVVHVGSDADARAAAGPRAEVIDLRGRTATPGLNDAHAHPMSVGQALLDVDITPERVGSIEGIGRAVKARLNGSGPGNWIIGRGYDQARMTDQRHPTRADLDVVAPNNPVFLYRACHHIAAVTVDRATLGIARVGCDPGAMQCDRVDGSDVVARSVQEDGMIRRDRIKVSPSRVALISHPGLIVAAADDPRPGACPLIRFLTARPIPSTEPTRSGVMSTSSSACPTDIGCAWASFRPGVAVRPRRSITSARGPAAARASASDPTCTTRPARIATAHATGFIGSTVMTWPLIKAMSADIVLPGSGVTCRI